MQKKKDIKFRSQLKHYSETEESEEDSDDNENAKRRSPRLQRKKSRVAKIIQQMSDVESDSKEDSDDVNYCSKNNNSYQQLIYESGKNNITNITKKQGNANATISDSAKKNKIQPNNVDSDDDYCKRNNNSNRQLEYESGKKIKKGNSNATKGDSPTKNNNNNKVTKTRNSVTKKKSTTLQQLLEVESDSIEGSDYDNCKKNDNFIQQLEYESGKKKLI